ncbi:glycosyl transferase [Bacillus inaquosorum]|nr:glycosyl transferase [Bacillus inaquosorum]
MFSGEASDVHIAAFLIANGSKQNRRTNCWASPKQCGRAYSSVLQLPPHIGGPAVDFAWPYTGRRSFSPPFLRLFYSPKAAYRHFFTAATRFHRNMQQAGAKTGPKVIGTVDIRLLQRD